MEHITIFGQGNMGQAIAGLFRDGGNDVTFVGKEDIVDIAGDIVVLAVPYGAIATIIEKNKAAFAGKIIIDISNPVDFSSMDSLVTPVGTSAAEEIAQALPESVLVKAFNTNLAATLISKKVGENPTLVQIAADDKTAKERLAALLQKGGVETLDAGGLKRARELEAMGFLQITLAVREEISWANGYALVK